VKSTCVANSVADLIREQKAEALRGAIPQR